MSHPPPRIYNIGKTAEILSASKSGCIAIGRNNFHWKPWLHCLVALLAETESLPTFAPVNHHAPLPPAHLPNVNLWRTFDFERRKIFLFFSKKGRGFKIYIWGSSSSQGYSPSSLLPPLWLRKEMTNIEWARHRHQSSYFIQQEQQQRQQLNDNNKRYSNNNVND